MTTRLLVPALTILFLGAAAAQDDTAKELKRLEGTWSATVHEAGGKALTADDKAKFKIKVEIKGDGNYTVFFGDKLINTGTLKVDPSKKPAIIDATHTDGPVKGKTQPGIYKFEGDDLQIVFTEPGKERPTSFKTREGTEEVLITYKRVAKSK